MKRVEHVYVVRAEAEDWTHLEVFETLKDAKAFRNEVLEYFDYWARASIDCCLVRQGVPSVEEIVEDDTCLSNLTPDS